ncbi:unnamed protein product [Durusdinium trenchii]|uniref:Uncharacterized protein n=2 Tax=Durusdinium trenchii TaxID=1381693 RepID=A0ABP0SHU9_9DINO
MPNAHGLHGSRYACNAHLQSWRNRTSRVIPAVCLQFGEAWECVAMAPVNEQEMQKELEKFKAMQETLQKAYEARMGLIAQQQETELVKEEFDSIEEDAVVYKLVGPVMVKQNVDDAKGNVTKRLEYISGELERSNKIIEEKEKELGEKQKHLIKMQQELQGG